MLNGLRERWFSVGVAAAAAGTAAFLLARLGAWPPHEDETLALFVGMKPLDELLGTVLGERGGAPLHFLIVHAVSQLSPSLTMLRAVSAVFAVASIPVIALLGARLAGRQAGLIAGVLAAASWVLLFHGIYGRMYSLLLFTSALSFLALLRAVERDDGRNWILYALAAYATLATHQYGAFILAAQAGFAAVLVLRGDLGFRRAAIAVGAVAVAAIPLWRSNLVLASRFDVSVGGDGSQLGGPVPVLEYLRSVLGDFVAGWTVLFAIVVALAVLGLAVLARDRPRSALLVVLVVLVPAVGLAVLGAGADGAAPETRHLIFLLPFFTMLVAVGLLRATRAADARAPAVTAMAVAALVAAELAWGWAATPTLYVGEPSRREAARKAAEAWLAQTSRPDDVLFGYDPLFLGARELGAPLGETVVPRADPNLALDTLLGVEHPLGRGVWVLDASDGSRIVSNASTRLEIDERTPGDGFEAHAFGPFLVVRTEAPTSTPESFLRDTIAVQRLGQILLVGNAELNYRTARLALEELTEAS